VSHRSHSARRVRNFADAAPRVRRGQDGSPATGGADQALARAGGVRYTFRMSDENTDSPLKLAIAGGAGRMGRALIGAALEAGHAVTGATESAGSTALAADIGGLAGRAALGRGVVAEVRVAAADADVWIDFTRPEATLAALTALDHTRISAVIIGTTGFSAADDTAIAAAAKRFAIVKTGNFSVGVHVLEAVTRLAAARLGPDWDVEILETHHRRKRDAPSGTALMLGAAAAHGRGDTLSNLRAPARDGADALRTGGSIGFAVRRSGGVIGEHEVTLASETEIIRLGHVALDRSVFAHGAIRAAVWAKGRTPGLYTLADVLGL
jgi:4-hydroxy-tetrahydrodipicolinate reductase